DRPVGHADVEPGAASLRLEAHDAGVVHAASRSRFPADALVLDLLGDARVPLHARAQRAGDFPVPGAVGIAAHRADVAHEAREVLEVAPECVEALHRDVEMQRLGELDAAAPAGTDQLAEPAVGGRAR